MVSMTKKKTQKRLLKEYNYIAFDFETTGLDVDKDVPIQIGLVQFDHTWTILNTYSSLIKPDKPVQELKSIVHFLTGFSVDALKTAPTVSSVMKEVEGFFTSKVPTVVVGHNIWFDCAMLEKYLDVDIAEQIDTFPLSKMLLHYLPSYALDVIHKHLVDKELVTASSNDSAHDALHDSYMSYDIFTYLIRKVQDLRYKHLILDYVLQHGSWPLTEIIDRSDKKYAFDEQKLFLPPLQSYSSSPKKIHTTDPLELPEQDRTTISTAQSSIHHLLTTIDRSTWPWVIACSHPSKLRIVENHLAWGYLSYSTLWQQVYFDAEIVNKFLQKKKFTSDEVWFIIKYCSHHAAWHAKLDINTWWEYKIFETVTKRKPRKRQSITLATHSQLRYHNDQINTNDKILFLDHDWRHKTYNHTHNKPFDPYYLLQAIDHACYTESIFTWAIRPELTQFIHLVSIFLWVLFSEIDAIFVWNDYGKMEVDALLDSLRMSKTRRLFEQVEQASTIIKTLPDNHASKIHKHLDTLKEYLSSHVLLARRTYNTKNHRYVFSHQQNYVGYDEFVDSLPIAQYYFCTNSSHRETDITIQPKETVPKTIDIKTIPKKHDIIKTLEGVKKDCFILSTSKEHSRGLFKELVAKGFHDTTTIVAENITWGVGKSIFQALHTDNPVIAIGWYNFYMALLAKKFVFSSIFIYHIYWGMKQQLVQDLIWYST